MRAVVLPRIVFLVLSLLAAATAGAAETPLELPPPLRLDLMPDTCEVPASLSELSLHDAVKVALCKAPNVQQARSAIAESNANLHTAQAKYFPSLHADADASRIGKHVRYPTHPASNYDLYAYSGNARLGLNWLLFDSGQRRAQNDQAHAKLTAALYNKVLANRDQAITVADLYYKASSAKVSATAAHEASARAEKNYHATKRLREEGVGSIADELLAKVAWQRSLVEGETKTTAAEITAIHLVTAIGLPSQTRISLPAATSTSYLTSSITRTTSDIAISAVATGSLTATTAAHSTLFDEPVAASVSRKLSHSTHSSGQDASPRSFDERILAAVRNHPRLAAAQANTAAAEAETRSIQAQHRPSISLQGNRGIGITPPANAIAKQHVNSWSIGLTVHIPLFDGLSTHYATDAARARTRMARETERTVWLQEEQKLLTDVNLMTSATQKISLLKDAESSATQAYRSAQIRYQQGVGTAIELLKAQDELAALQQAVIDLHYERLASQFRLAVALDALPPVHH